MIKDLLHFEVPLPSGNFYVLTDEVRKVIAKTNVLADAMGGVPISKRMRKGTNNMPLEPLPEDVIGRVTDLQITDWNGVKALTGKVSLDKREWRLEGLDIRPVSLTVKELQEDEAGSGMVSHIRSILYFSAFPLHQTEPAQDAH